MPRTPDFFRRLLRPALTLAAAAAVLLAFVGCPGVQIVSVNNAAAIPVNEVTVGDNVDLRIKYNFTEGNDLIIYGVTGVFVQDAEGVDSRDVENVVWKDSFPHRGTITLTFSIRAAASARPLFIAVTGGNLDMRTFFTGSRDRRILYVRNPDTIGAPQISNVTAGGSGNSALSHRRGANGIPAQIPAIERGRTVDVEFTGTNFDASAQVIAEDPATTITDVTYSAGTGNVRAKVTTPVNARTGYSRFYIQTTGGQSALTEIRVRAGTAPSGNRPALIRAYPNTVEAGTSTEVTLSGDELVGAQIAMEPANPNVSVSTEVIDANTLRATFDVGPSVSGSVQLFAQSSGGRSIDPISLTFVTAGTPLPRISSIAPDSVTAGVATGVQVRIVGEHLAGEATIDDAYLLPNPTVGQAGFNLVRYYPSDPAARNGSVVLLLSVFAQNTGDPLPTGPVDLALRRSDGITTNVLKLIIAPPPSPADGKPFVSRIFPNSIRRPDQRLEIISGMRLTDITGIVFDHPGITATFIDAKPDGTEIRFSFDAAPDAVLSGDQATNFHLLTEHGRSNDASFVVSP